MITKINKNHIYKINGNIVEIWNTSLFKVFYHTYNKILKSGEGSEYNSLSKFKFYIQAKRIKNI